MSTAMNIRTARLELMAQTPADVLAKVEQMTPEQRAEISPEWLARVRAAADVDPWTLGFVVMHRASDAVIGSCGFKGPPDLDGVVEIAYGVAPEHEGQGYATEAADALVAFAFNSGQVRTVRAHTFAAANASTRVLTKCGFRLIGEVVDPEDGLVWRWERDDNRSG